NVATGIHRQCEVYPYLVVRGRGRRVGVSGRGVSGRGAALFRRVIGRAARCGGPGLGARWGRVVLAVICATETQERSPQHGYPLRHRSNVPPNASSLQSEVALPPGVTALPRRSAHSTTG